MIVRYPQISTAAAILTASLILMASFFSGPMLRAADGEPSPTAGLSADWDHGMTWESDSGRLKLRFGGRLLADAGWFDADREVEDTVNGGQPLDSAVDFRRARLCLSGSYAGRLIFKADYDFVNVVEDYRNFRDLYVGLRGLPVAGTVRFGNVKEPMGLEQQASTNHTPFTERSLASFLLPLRNRGIVNQAGLPGGRMTWAAGLYKDVDGYNRGKGSGITLSGRFTALPWRPADDRLLHVGIACSRRDLDHLQVKAAPESFQTPAYLDTGQFSADGALITNFESALLLGPLSLQGEFVRSAVDSPAAGDPVFDGGYLQVSWYITGEHRAYDPAQGKFVQTSLKNNVFKGEGPGAWQVAARWSMIDLDDGEIRGGRLNDFTLGLNWHLNAHCRLMLDGIHAHLADAGDTLIATLRIQIDY